MARGPPHLAVDPCRSRRDRGRLAVTATGTERGCGGGRYPMLCHGMTVVTRERPNADPGSCRG